MPAFVGIEHGARKATRSAEVARPRATAVAVPDIMVPDLAAPAVNTASALSRPHGYCCRAPPGDHDLRAQSAPSSNVNIKHDYPHCSCCSGIRPAQADQPRDARVAGHHRSHDGVAAVIVEGHRTARTRPADQRAADRKAQPFLSRSEGAALSGGRRRAAAPPPAGEGMELELKARVIRERRWCSCRSRSWRGDRGLLGAAMRGVAAVGLAPAPLVERKRPLHSVNTGLSGAAVVGRLACEQRHRADQSAEREGRGCQYGGGHPRAYPSPAS